MYKAEQKTVIKLYYDLYVNDRFWSTEKSMEMAEEKMQDVKRHYSNFPARRNATFMIKEAFKTRYI